MLGSSSRGKYALCEQRWQLRIVCAANDRERFFSDWRINRCSKCDNTQCFVALVKSLVRKRLNDGEPALNKLLACTSRVRSRTYLLQDKHTQFIIIFGRPFLIVPFLQLSRQARLGSSIVS